VKELALWKFILANLKKKIKVILVIVVNHEEGSPGKEGFKMVVSQDGKTIGSVGGGVMELNIIENAKQNLKKGINVNYLEKLYHKRQVNKNRSGLICSGTQTNFTVTLSQKNIKLIETICTTIKNSSPGILKISTPKSSPPFTQGGHGGFLPPSDINTQQSSRPFKYISNFQKGLLKNNKTRISSINENSITNYSVTMSLIPDNRSLSHFNYSFKSPNNWSYEENIGYKETVFVVGGGHVGLQVCKILSLMDFFVIVYDDRKNIPTLKENKFAHKKIIDNYENLSSYITEPHHTYIVIVTTGYISDLTALRQVADLNCRYIGLMGTKVKIKKIFNEAVKEGTPKELLKKIHAPIGIDINSNTPEEIAISITAQIIKIKNSR
jgi:xanthine dehydrogenase accessory factor